MNILCLTKNQRFEQSSHLLWLSINILQKDKVFLFGSHFSFYFTYFQDISSIFIFFLFFLYILLVKYTDEF